MPPEVEETDVDVEEVPEVDEEVEETGDEPEEVEKPVANNQAQALFDLLNNQATAKSTLQLIASNLGLSVSEARSEEGQKAIKDVIKEAMGEDLAFLSDKLGPLGDAIEKHINARISKVENDINTRAKEREAAVFQTQSEKAIIDLGKETKGEFTNLLPAITKLMEEIPIGKSTSPDAYLRRLYTIAKSEAGTKVNTSKERIEKARRESSANTLLTSGNPTRTKSGSSPAPTIREAVQAAMRGEKFK